MSLGLQWDSLRAAGRPYKCVLRIARMIGLCPHVKNHPLGGWMFIVNQNHALDAWFGKNYIVEPYKQQLL